MAVTAIIGSFEIYGLRLKTQKELNELVDKMEVAMRTVHENIEVEVELEVEAQEGKLEE